MNLQEIYTTIAPKLSQFGRVVIAGGAVRDDLMKRPTKDIDVFVMSPREHKDAMPDILGALKDLPQVKAEVEWHKSEPFLVTSVRVGDHEVQVMTSTAQHPVELIMGFDWNVCLFGYDGKQHYVHESLDNIGTGKMLRLHRVTYPMSTLRRGFRFSERFLMQLNPVEVNYLCSLIARTHSL